MTAHVNRRDFLKFLAAGAAAIPVAAIASKVKAATRLLPFGQSLVDAATQDPFTSLPSNLILGAPLADISMGWDGTVWGIDSNGIPYQYDQVTQKWEVFGSSLDAVAYVTTWQGQTTGSTDNPYFNRPVIVRGTQVTAPNGQVGAITDFWHGLPDSFTLGLDGAAEAGGVLHLFRHGRYVTIDDATGNASAAQDLRALQGWPQSDNWQHGAIDAVGSNYTTLGDTRVRLWSNGEYVRVDMGAKQIIDGPNPMSFWFGEPLLGIMQNGFSAEVQYAANDDNLLFAYQGPVQWSSNGTGATPSAPDFNPVWTPTLLHAPSGRAGALYAVLPYSGYSAGVVIMHDGTGWQGSYFGPYEFIYVAAGKDGTVFALNEIDENSEYQLMQLQADGVTWDVLSTFNGAAAQLSVGDMNHIWLRDQAGLVYQYSGSGFTQVTTIEGATHINANPDGTVWHAKGDTNAYRLISERDAAPTALNLANGETINRVASTAFGTAFILASNSTMQASAMNDSGVNASTTAMYSYDSLYAFKTSKSYMPGIQNGFNGNALIAAGNLLLVMAHDGDIVGNQDGMFITALDAQTGVEVWPNRFFVPGVNGGTPCNGITYDAGCNLVYVAYSSFIYAIDGTQGTLVWQYNAPTEGLFQMTGLANGKLAASFYNEVLQFIQIDTGAALAQAQQQQAISADWAVTLPQDLEDGGYFGAPVGDGQGNWCFSFSADLANFTVTSLSMADGTRRWQVNLASAQTTPEFIPFDCLVGQTQAPNAQKPQAALFVNANSTIFALDPVTGNQLQHYTIPNASNIQGFSSQMAYINDQLVVGDNFGKLYVLNALNMQLVASTADPFQDGWQGVWGQPQILHTDDPTDTVGIFFTRGDDNLWLFDPSTSNLEQIATDQTASTYIEYDETHGLLYAFGWNTDGGYSKGQVFALRPNQALQAERAFVIESQLLQDYGSDDEAAGNGVARYQTHVTIVDDTNAPMPTTAIKLWADDDSNATVVQVDGTSYTIGTDTPAYFTSDATGSFTIVSDASDLAATTLYVWAAFMDASERMTIEPDAAFHQRLALTTASGSTDPTQTDPKQIDLSNAASYDKTPLFSTSSSDQTNASQVAGAITQTTSSAGIGANPATAMRRTAAGMVARSAQLLDTAPKYTAYSDLPGMSYSAVSAPSSTGIGVVNPAGISLTANGYSSVAPADASAQIDAMTGDEVTIAGVQSFLSKLKDAWKEIKQDATKVVQAAVSIAKDIAVGIQYVVNGVTKVVKAIAQDIKDAMAFIGSIFKQFLKDIENVIEALSLLLHLDEVLKTASLLNTQINAAFSDITNVLNAGQSTVDNWFSNANQQISNSFCNLYSSLGLPTPTNCSPSTSSIMSSTPFNTYNSVGSTSNTVYNQGNSSGQSQSVQCGWSGHTLRKNMGNASTPDSALQAGVQSDPFLDLLTSFGQNLMNDPALSAAISGTGNSFKSTFQASSISDFMKMALEDLLQVVEVVALAGLDVLQALLNTILSDVSTVVSGLQNFGNMNIPILSALWKKFTGNDLTFLDVICFVLAFPVTLMYRAISGHYPSQDASATGAAVGNTELQWTRNLMGIAGSISQFVMGLVTGVMDGITAYNTTNAGAKVIGIGWKIAAIFSLMTLSSSNVFKAALTPKTYPLFAAVLSAALPVSIVLNIVSGTLMPPQVVSILNAILNTAVVFIAVDIYTTTTNPNLQAQLTLSRTIIAAFPGIINPIKFASSPVCWIAPGADAVCRTAAGVITVLQTIDQWDTPLTDPPPPVGWQDKTYFPIIGRQ